MITEDYVSYETAKLLKEKGFNESTDKQFNSDKIVGDYNITDRSRNPERYLDASTLQMAMKWLREVHNRYVEICMDKAHNFKDIVFRPAIYDKSLDCLWGSDNFPTYEEACEKAIKYCLENLI